MTTINEQLQTTFAEFLAEDAKFTGGNAAAGTRSRKALAELSKLVKARRNEITAEKNARAEAKKAAK
jgi:Histone H1-like protein Hc1